MSPKTIRILLLLSLPALLLLAIFTSHGCSNRTESKLIGSWTLANGSVGLVLGKPDGVSRFHIVLYARPPNWVADDPMDPWVQGDPGDPGFSGEGTWQVSDGILYLAANENLRNFEPGIYPYKILKSTVNELDLKPLNDLTGLVVFRYKRDAR